MARRRMIEKPGTRAGAERPAGRAEGVVPGAIRSLLEGTEAASVGLVHAVSETVVTAVRGAQEVGAEIGSTAVSTVRGTIRAAEEIGGDIGRLATTATEGVVATVGEVGGEVARVAMSAVDAVQRAGASAVQTLGIGGAPAPRKPPRKMEARARRSRRRRAAAA